MVSEFGRRIAVASGTVIAFVVATFALRHLVDVWPLAFGGVPLDADVWAALSHVGLTSSAVSSAPMVRRTAPRAGSASR